MGEDVRALLSEDNDSESSEAGEPVGGSEGNRESSNDSDGEPSVAGTQPASASGESESDKSSDSPHRDSQVGSGWLGKAFNEVCRMDREEKAVLQKLRASLMEELSSPDMNSKMVNHPSVVRFMLKPEVIDEYMVYAATMVNDFGAVISPTLAQTSHYLKWIYDQKMKQLEEQDRVLFHGILYGVFIVAVHYVGMDQTQA